MATPNGIPDELMLKVERWLFTWISLSDESISGKDILSSMATVVLLMRFYSSSLSFIALCWAMWRSSSIESTSSFLILGERCSGQRSEKDAFLTMPLIILERMVTSPRYFDVGFVFVIRLDLLSAQSHSMLNAKYEMGVCRQVLLMFKMNDEVAWYVLVIVRETH